MLRKPYEQRGTLLSSTGLMEFWLSTVVRLLIQAFKSTKCFSFQAGIVQPFENVYSSQEAPPRCSHHVTDISPCGDVIDQINQKTA